VVGVLCVELFLTRGGELLINELARGAHNSGRFTFDACVTSQFEQQLRAVCELPLGSTEQMRPAAMANLLGEVWAAGTPDWAAACRFQGVKLHLYGKARRGRAAKMGRPATRAARTRRPRCDAGGARGDAHGLLRAG
jgi:5-(carboxyamino)imidazole ribonucleotide synthase